MPWTQREGWEMRVGGGGLKERSGGWGQNGWSVEWKNQEKGMSMEEGASSLLLCVHGGLVWY